MLVYKSYCDRVLRHRFDKPLRPKFEFAQVTIRNVQENGHHNVQPLVLPYLQYLAQTSDVNLKQHQNGFQAFSLAVHA